MTIRTALAYSAFLWAMSVVSACNRATDENQSDADTGESLQCDKRPVVQKSETTSSGAPEKGRADMLITWTGFDGILVSDPEKARYVVDGRDVGIGSKGFSEVISHFKRLRHGATVYVYPDRMCSRVVNNLVLTIPPGSGPGSYYFDSIPFRSAL